MTFYEKTDLVAPPERVEERKNYDGRTPRTGETPATKTALKGFLPPSSPGGIYPFLKYPAGSIPHRW